MNWTGAEQLANTPFTNMTIDGVPVAAVQNVNNFSFAYVDPSCHFAAFCMYSTHLSYRRVYAAGHEVVSPLKDAIWYTIFS